MLTVEELKEALPIQLKRSATQPLVDKFNQIMASPEEAEIYRNNLISYTKVLNEGRFKVEDYISAVIYCSHKMMGNTNQDSWKKTFPQRYQRLVTMGTSEKDVSAYVAAYNKTKLVTLLMEQTLVPTWILNADIYQAAINTQYELMTDATQSGKVRTEAANSLLTHLKRPETKKVEIDLGAADNSGMSELRGMLAALAQKQIEMIEGGVTTKEIAHQKLIGTETKLIITDGIEDAQEL